MTDTTTDTVLRLERTFDAPREDVFDAWTNPEVLRRWWAAGPDWETPVAEVDLREGGSYRLAMRDPGSGMQPTVGGEFTEVRRPERLVYTWTWEDLPDPSPSAGSVVTVEFEEHDGRTTVKLVHSGLGNDQALAWHEHGWNACLDNLERRVFAA
jgi:uncharacterized protein YndB with AHSA1/START domain